MSDLTITIPVWVWLPIAITIVWWAGGFVINTLVIQRLRDRWMRRHKTGTIPNWWYPVAYGVCGPLGWIAYTYDAIASAYRKRQREQLRKADNDD